MNTKFLVISKILNEVKLPKFGLTPSQRKKIIDLADDLSETVSDKATELLRHSIKHKEYKHLQKHKKHH